MTTDSDEWNADLALALDAPNHPATSGEPELQPLAYPTLEDWVEGLLAPMYRRAVDGRATTWCPEWWRHAEALTRLEAIWRAWEHLRLDPMTGISVWFTMHADPHMGVLLDPSGPFSGCTPNRGHRTNNLPALPTTPRHPPSSGKVGAGTASAARRPASSPSPTSALGRDDAHGEQDHATSDSDCHPLLGL